MRSARSSRATATRRARVSALFFLAVAEWFRSLDPESYPAIASGVDALVAGGGDQRFAFGVETFIAGIASRIPPSAG